MENNATNAVSRRNEEASKGGELTALVRNLAVPSLEKVLRTALTNGSLHAAQATGALSSDQELQAILGGFSPYSVSEPSEAAREVARDFTTVYTAGLPEERLAAVRRLTAGFWSARTALEAATQQAPPEEMQTLRSVITRLHAGYVLLIATVHTLLEGAPPALFSAFRELLDADNCLKELSGWFVDIRAAESPSARRVAVRLMFNKFCSEATKPTIYGDAISALVQSMLIRELRQVLQNDRRLAPHLASYFEERMRSEVQTARNGDGKPQPVLEALRRCPTEARGLMDAVVSFVLENETLPSGGQVDSRVACEVVLSVGCLLPGVGLVRRLEDAAGIDETPASTVMLFLSALKFSCGLPESERADLPGLVRRGLEILPRLSPDHRLQMIREVFAPLVDYLIEHLAVSEDGWRTMSSESREACIEDVFATRLAGVECGTVTMTVAHDRTVVAALLTHLALSESIDKDGEHGAALPAVCVRWLIRKTATCDVSPELCTALVRYVVERGGGFNALGPDPEAVTALLLRGGFPTLQLLSRDEKDHEWLARMVGKYVPTSEEQCDYIQEVVSSRFIDGLRSLVNRRASALDTRVLTGRSLETALEVQANLAKERQQAEALSLQIALLTDQLENDAEYLRVERDRAEAEKEHAVLLKEYNDLAGMTEKELVAARKLNYKAGLADRVAEKAREFSAFDLRKFVVPDEVRYQLTNWKASEIMFGQFQDMKNLLLRLNEKLQRADELVEELRASMRETDEEVQQITNGIRQFFPLVRCACQSAALRSLEAADVVMQDIGSADLLGVMCRANLLLARYKAPLNSGGAANEAVPSWVTDLGSEISIALQTAFRDASQVPLTLAVLTDLADLAADSSVLFAEWPEAVQHDTKKPIRLQDLEQPVSLMECLWLNMRYDQQKTTVSWGGSRMGWDESFYGPIIRLFAGVSGNTQMNKQGRLAAVSLARNGIISAIKCHVDVANQAQEDAHLPVEERRQSPFLVPAQDLLRAFTLVLKTTQGRPVGLPDDDRKLPKYPGIAAWLATRVQGEIADAGETALDSVFIPAAKIMRSLSREEGKVLYPLPEGCHTFLKLVAQRIDQRKNVSSSGSSNGAVSPGHYTVPVSGLRFEEEIFTSLSLPEVQRPAWLRLENHQ